MTLFEIGNIVVLFFVLSFQLGLRVQNQPPGFWLGLIAGLLAGVAVFAAIHVRVGKLSERSSDALTLASFVIVPTSALVVCHIVWLLMRYVAA